MGGGMGGRWGGVVAGWGGSNEVGLSTRHRSTSNVPWVGIGVEGTKVGIGEGEGVGNGDGTGVGLVVGLWVIVGATVGSTVGAGVTVGCGVLVGSDEGCSSL